MVLARPGFLGKLAKRNAWRYGVLVVPGREGVGVFLGRVCWRGGLGGDLPSREIALEWGRVLEMATCLTTLAGK